MTEFAERATLLYRLARVPPGLPHRYSQPATGVPANDVIGPDGHRRLSATLADLALLRRRRRSCWARACFRILTRTPGAGYRQFGQWRAG